MDQNTIINLWRPVDVNGTRLFSQIPNCLLHSVIKGEFNQTQSKIVIFIARMSFGMKGSEETMYLSLKDFKDNTGINASHLSKAIKALLNKKVIFRVKKNGEKYMYSINMIRYGVKMKYYRIGNGNSDKRNGDYVLSNKDYELRNSSVSSSEEIIYNKTDFPRKKKLDINSNIDSNINVNNEIDKEVVINTTSLSNSDTLVGDGKTSQDKPAEGFAKKLLNNFKNIKMRTRPLPFPFEYNEKSRCEWVWVLTPDTCTNDVAVETLVRDFSKKMLATTDKNEYMEIIETTIKNLLAGNHGIKALLAYYSANWVYYSANGKTYKQQDWATLFSSITGKVKLDPAS